MDLSIKQQIETVAAHKAWLTDSSVPIEFWDEAIKFWVLCPTPIWLAGREYRLAEVHHPKTRPYNAEELKALIDMVVTAKKDENMYLITAVSTDSVCLGPLGWKWVQELLDYFTIANGKACGIEDEEQG